MPKKQRFFRLPWRTRTQIRQDIDDELAFHLEMRAKELVDRGVSPGAARDTARHQFGDLEYTRAYCNNLDTSQERATRTREWAATLLQDAQYAVRSLRKTPGFSLVAVLTLALGIGANTAIFSVVYGVLLKPLPFAAPDRLVRVLGLDPGGGHPPVSPLDLRDYRASSRTLATIAALTTSPTTITAPDAEPEQIERASVSTNFLPMLGVRPAVGTHLTPQDDFGSRAREVMISERLWRRRFGGDAAIVGKSIMLDDQSMTIVGVVPNSQIFPQTADVWSPIALNPELTNPPLRIARFLRVYARLAPGATVAGAQAELSLIAKRLADTYPQTNDRLGVDIRGLQDYLVGDLKKPFAILLGAVALVLLIACANVANLLLVRAGARASELAIRRAIGATRARVVRQLVTESVLLSLTGAAAGVALALWGTGRLAALAGSRIPRLDAVHVDGAVLAVTALIATVTGIIFGVLPAWSGTGGDFTRALKEGRRTGGTAPSRRIRRSLVIAQAALSLVLLAGSGLLLRSFTRVRQVDPGFKPDGLITFDLSIRRNPPTVSKVEYRRQLVGQLVDQLRSVPGVRDVAVTSGLPLSGASFILNFEIDGRPPTGAKLAAEIRSTTPEYFRTMGIGLERGRLPGTDDRAGAPLVAVINEAAAREFFAGIDPIGQRFHFTNSKDAAEIVGVVGNVREYELSATPQPVLYTVFAQQPTGDLSVVMRTGSDHAPVMAAATKIVHGLDANLAVRQPRSYDDVIDLSMAQSRMYVVLLGLFAAAALALAGVGMYGVASYSVNQRRHELGVRMALGASTGSIAGLVLREGMMLTGAGLAIGLIGAWWGTRLLARLIVLYDVSPNDPIALVGAAAVLVVSGLIACYRPARRAGRTDPTVAMRAD